MAAAETLAPGASADTDDAARQAACNRARLGHWDVFGFTPLFGLKTLLSLGGAWLGKGNKTAAVITVTLHDVLLPFVPAMFFWQYKLGMWALHGYVPQRPGFRHMGLYDYVDWTTFLTVGRPILIGSLFFALPAAVVVYFGLRGVLLRAGQRTPED